MAFGGMSGPRAAFRLLFAALLTVGVGNAMLFAVLPPLAREIGLPDMAVGAIFSLSALLWVLSSPFWGRFSDRVGRKPVVALGLGAYALSMAAFASVAALGLMAHWAWPAVFVGLMLARSIFGMVGSAASPAAQAYVADRTSPAERTEELAALGAAFSLGSAIGPGVCAWLAVELGLVTPIGLTSVLAAVAAFCVWRFLPEAPREPELALARARTGPAAWRLALDPRVAPYIIFGVGMSTVTGALAQTFTFFTMDRLGVSGSAGAELAAAGFMVGALALLATQLAILPRLKLGARALMAGGTVLVCLGVLAQALSGSLSALLVSQLLQGVGFGLARSGYSGGASLSVRPDEQGALAGLVVAANGAGFIVSPLIGGGLYQFVGPAAPLWACLAMLSAMASFALFSRRLKASAGATPPSQSPHE